MMPIKVWGGDWRREARRPLCSDLRPLAHHKGMQEGSLLGVWGVELVSSLRIWGLGSRWLENPKGECQRAAPGDPREGGRGCLEAGLFPSQSDQSPASRAFISGSAFVQRF